ncbi:hypothetical protein vseg_002459 [Gypsophila vaccaria]
MATLLSAAHHRHRHRRRHHDIEQGRRSSVSDHHYSDDDDDNDSCTVERDPPSPNSPSPSSSSSSCCYLSECSVEDEEEEVAAAAGEEEEEVDLENGDGDRKLIVELVKMESDCRICHLSLDGSDDPEESGSGMELGCSCKGDLAVAHKLCADTWFKIRGNRTCEICGSIARNVVGVNEVELVEQWTEVNDTAPAAALPPHPAETRHFWQGHRFLNFLLACMVFAFVISWLFHFNVPS